MSKNMLVESGSLFLKVCVVSRTTSLSLYKKCGERWGFESQGQCKSKEVDAWFCLQFLVIASCSFPSPPMSVSRGRETRV
jgi:hypothetical protein